MSNFQADYLEKAKITLFYEPNGVDKNGNQKIRLKNIVRVTPFDATDGYQHETQYYMTIRIDGLGLVGKDSEPLDVILERATNEMPSVTALGSQGPKDQVFVHKLGRL